MLAVRRSFKICVFALLAAGSSLFGSMAYGNTSKMTVDLLRLMKEFGFASIIPLGLVLAPKRNIYQLVTLSILLSTSFNVAIQFTGYQDLLPIFVQFADLGYTQRFRPTGAVSNPNDFAYISAMGLAFAVASWMTARGTRLSSRAVPLVGMLLCLYGIVTSGSRSAIVGVLFGGMFYLARAKNTFETKLWLSVIVALALIIGWNASPVFQRRMDLALTDRLQEPSLGGRIEAQLIAVRTWYESPLGVGVSNMPEATRPYSGDAEAVVAVTGSDNIYVDFLLGSGIEGLAFLLLCFGTCWRLTTTLSVTSATIVYRSAVVFTLSAGLATIAPASTFVAPFFFALVGVAAIPRESPHDPTSPR